jgi:hypothetical protein
MSDGSKPVTMDELKKYCEDRCEMYKKWFDYLATFQMSLDLTATSMRDQMTVMTAAFGNMTSRFDALERLIKQHMAKDDFHMVNPVVG